jgi:hypothetical protein
LICRLRLSAGSLRSGAASLVRYLVFVLSGPTLGDVFGQARVEFEVWKDIENWATRDGLEDARWEQLRRTYRRDCVNIARLAQKEIRDSNRIYFVVGIVSVAIWIALCSLLSTMFRVESIISFGFLTLLFVSVAYVIHPVGSFVFANYSEVERADSDRGLRIAVIAALAVALVTVSAPHLGDGPGMEATFRAPAALALLSVFVFFLMLFLSDAVLNYLRGAVVGSRRHRFYPDLYCIMYATNIVYILGDDNVLSSIYSRRVLYHYIVTLSEVLLDVRTYMLRASSREDATLSRRFDEASAAIAEYRTWVGLPQDGTLQELRRRMADFCAIVISRNYHELPVIGGSLDTARGSKLRFTQRGNYARQLASALVPAAVLALYLAFGPGLPPQLVQWVGSFVAAWFLVKVLALIDPSYADSIKALQPLLPGAAGGNKDQASIDRSR